MAAPLNTVVYEYTDALAWNDVVLAQPRHHLLQSWGWGELKGRWGWTPLRIAVHGGGCVAAAQVLFRRMLGLSVAYVPRGPLWSGDAALDAMLLRALRRVAHRRRAAFLRLEPNILATDPEANAMHSWLQLQGFRPAAPLQPRTSIHLPLRALPAALFAAASKGHRADVRRAEREGVTVVDDVPGDFEAFYRIMQTTAHRGQFGIHAAGYYRDAWAAFNDPQARQNDAVGDARLFVAHKAGEAVAAFLVFAWGREAHYMYSGSTEAGLKSGANHLLQWHAIQWAQRHGCERYDFWGVPDLMTDLDAAPPEERAALEAQAKAHPLYGVYRFKKGWGGAVVRYLPAYDDVYLPPAYWWWQRRQSA